MVSAALFLMAGEGLRVNCSFTFSPVSYRLFRNMDDDGSKNLDYAEFKKGIHDYGLGFEDSVSSSSVCDCDTDILERSGVSSYCLPTILPL